MVLEKVSNESKWEDIQWESTNPSGTGQENWKGHENTWEHFLIVLKNVCLLILETRNQLEDTKCGREPKGI